MASTRVDPRHGLSGKVAVVTGAGRGIGLTIAEAYVHAGAHVALLDRDHERLQDAVAELTGGVQSPLAVTADIRYEDDIDRAVALVGETLGPIDVLVNNAAVLMSFVKGDAPGRPNFWDIDPARWRELWDINMTGTWLCSRRVAPEMITAGRGSIINLTTSFHTMRSERHIPYGPSKAAIDAFTVAAAKQLRAYGVRVNALLPGQAVNDRGGADPNLGPSDAVVQAALYLASDESIKVTGQAIIADEFNRERGLLRSDSVRAD